MENNCVREQQFTTVIVPKTRLLDFHLKELIRYRDLIFLFVKRNFVSHYKQTVLGPAWALIQPLLTTLVFTIVFGRIAGLAPGGVPSFLFFMSGNIAWGYFSGCLTSTASTFTGNAGIFGKVYFPRLVSPISNMIRAASVLAVSSSFAIIRSRPYLRLATPLLLSMPLRLQASFRICRVSFAPASPDRFLPSGGPDRRMPSALQ